MGRHTFGVLATGRPQQNSLTEARYFALSKSQNQNIIYRANPSNFKPIPTGTREIHETWHDKEHLLKS